MTWKHRFISIISFIIVNSPVLFSQGNEEGPYSSGFSNEFCWSKEKSDFAQVEVAVASPGVIQNFIQVSGRVATHPDLLAFVSPKVHGVVTQIYKNLGDCVECHELLAVIESQEIAEAKSAYLAAIHKWEFQRELLGKEERLRGISAGQDYFQAQFAYKEATFNKELALHKLHSLGVTDEQVAHLRSDDRAAFRFYEVRSPIKGKILQRVLTIGEWLDDESRIFTIGNFDRVWVEMHVPQSDVRYLTAGLPVEVAGAMGKLERVNLSSYSPIINEETRTATAIAVIDNRTGIWSPGEFVAVSIQTDHSAVPLAIPKEALLNIKGAEYVFVQTADQFVPSLVKVGKQDGKNVEILSGLKVGEAYAACNTFCLKAEFEKEAGENHH